jgi:hypothetical protein
MPTVVVLGRSWRPNRSWKRRRGAGAHQLLSPRSFDGGGHEQRVHERGIDDDGDRETNAQLL